MHVSFVIQVDTLCHSIPELHRKGGARAGVTPRVHRPGKHQSRTISSAPRRNRTTSPNTARCCWPGSRSAAFTYAGYILGFPDDTPEIIRRDIEIIQRELPLDILEFFCLTPLPGSEDHQRLSPAGAPMDPDLNKYDLEHVADRASAHVQGGMGGHLPRGLEALLFPQHMRTIMRRAAATGVSAGAAMFLLLWFWGCVKLEKLHPLQGGYLRRKYRRDRRPGLALEHPLLFYPRYGAELVSNHIRLAAMAARLGLFRLKLKRNKEEARAYMDQALTPPTQDDLDQLDLFQHSKSSRAAGEKAKQKATREAERAH